MTMVQRAQKFKAAQRARGLVQCNVWLPATAVAEFRQAAEAIAANPAELRIGRLVNVRTGRVARLTQ